MARADNRLNLTAGLIGLNVLVSLGFRDSGGGGGGGEFLGVGRERVML